MKDFLNKLSKVFANIGFIALIAFLGAEGGQGVKWVRRFILPAIVTIYTYFLLHNIWVLTVYSMSGALSFGYGIPDAGYPTNPNADSGSFIGRFFWKLFKKNNTLANSASRAVIAILISASMLSVPILKGTWLSFIIGAILIITIWATVAWRNSGSIPVKILGKVYTLLNVDLIVYGTTACGIMLIVYGFLG
jgi:hypothetical protein